MTVYRCKDSIESIFTAIYRAYEEKREIDSTRIELNDEPLLFAEDIPVRPDEEKAEKVIRTLVRRFGEEDYLAVCMALSSEDEEKAQAVFRTVALGIADHCRPGHLFDRLSDDLVAKAFALSRAAGREADHLKGFLRFREMENGILYAKIGPKNNTLTFLMPHFADRLPLENFVIFDDRRGLFGIHPAGRQWYLLSGVEIREPECGISQEEAKYRELFREFVETIAIRERKNLKLQRNMLPLRYQKYMTEFQ